MNAKVKKYLTVMTLGLAGGSIYFLPYIKYIFYDAQIASMGITNTQSGLLLTMYTIGNMILYIPGGIIADKVSPKKALVVSLLSTAALVYIYAFTMNFQIAMVIWTALSFSTAFVFWSSLMKAVRIIGTEEEQGFMYGLYYACNGITAALTNTIALNVYKTAGGDVKTGFFRAVLVGGSMAVLAAVLLMFLMDGKKKEEAVSDEPKFQMRDVGKLLKNPFVWIVSFTILCGYGFYTSISYFNPYLTEVMGVSPESSGFISIVRNYLLLLLAPVGGLIADKLFHSTCKWLCTSFLALAALFGAVLILPSDISPLAASLYTLIPGAFAMMMYGVVFSTVSEAGIPRAMTGTVIGIASIIGYMPDSIYSVLFGKWLDTYGGAGYNYIFGFLAASGVVGAVLAMLVYKNGKKAKKEIQE
ncbi:MAG: MFS transporter [Bacillota bacterium]|nr:MFS transporter [Bacillota bacterium]MEE0469165.1 MFS transporter [Blautia sp.]